LIRSVFGKKFVSVPFAPYGGVCSENFEIYATLMNYAARLADELNAKCEIRYFNHSNFFECYPINVFSSSKFYSTFILDLNKGVEHIWNNLNKKVRNMIRKGKKNNLKFEIHDDKEAIRDFYEIYCENMKRLGTPVHSLKFFVNIYRNFKDNVLIAKIMLNNEIISSLYLLRFKSTIISGWGASLKDFLKYAPNDFIYWNSIKWACENGFKWFDFGRSLINSGNYKFKKRWGTLEIPLFYCYYPPTETILPPQSKYEMFAKMWSKLPLRMVKKFGPTIRKYIV